MDRLELQFLLIVVTVVMTIGSLFSLPDKVDCAFMCVTREETDRYGILARAVDTAIFVTREQRGHPHLLVLPIRHVPTIFELSNSEVASVAIAVREAAILIDRAYSRPGIAIWQNNGTPAGQAISHVHFHVAGTLPGGGTKFGEVNEISVEDTDRIAETLQLYS